MALIRPPAIAGMFYPKDGKQAGRAVMDFVAEAEKDAGTAPPPSTPKAIIAPHAGWKYSGACAAAAYARLLPDRDKISRIILMGPCHRVRVQGLATTSADYWKTPIGPAQIDRDALESLSDLKQVSTHDAAHQEEHSLEVHLPFLQMCFGHMKLVPFAVGSATAEQVAEVLERLWGGRETRIVISTDLSHFLDYDSCTVLDARTADAIESFAYDRIGPEHACGRIPLSGLLYLAKRDGLKIQRVGLCNSGDTAGDKARVVGYGSWTVG